MQTAAGVSLRTACCSCTSAAAYSTDWQLARLSPARTPVTKDPPVAPLELRSARANFTKPSGKAVAAKLVTTISSTGGRKPTSSGPAASVQTLRRPTTSTDKQYLPALSTVIWEMAALHSCTRRFSVSVSPSKEAA